MVGQLKRAADSWRRRPLKKLIGIGVTVAAVITFIGGLGDGVTHLNDLWDYSAGRWGSRFTLMTIAAIAVAALSFVAGRQIGTRTPDQVTSKQLDEAVRLIDVDYQMFLNLEQLALGSVGEREAALAVEDALENISRYFGTEIVRATVYRPRVDALVAWVGFEMPADSLARAVFPYKPEVGTPKGEVLEAWETGEVRFNGCREKNGKRVFRSRHYRPSEKNPDNRPYRSFVCVPFQGAPRNSIGAVCFDSQSALLFDPRGKRKQQELERDLTALAARLSSTVAVAIRISNPDSVTDRGEIATGQESIEQR